MKNLLKKIILILLFITLVFTIYQWIAPSEYNPRPNSKDLFDSWLDEINSMKKLELYLDNNAKYQNPEKYTKFLDQTLRNKFFHSYSYYDFSNNWVMAIIDKLFTKIEGERAHYAAIVIPKDIIKYSYAACSQQAIVFMELLKNKGYLTRKVGLQGHFCSEVFYDESWHFFDTNLEPNLPSDNPGIQKLKENENLIYKAYENNYNPTITKNKIKEIFSKYDLGKINEFPAKNIRIVHILSKIISNFLWIILLIIYLTINKLKIPFKKKSRYYEKN